jgi:ribosomal protein L37AE/L43A
MPTPVPGAPACPRCGSAINVRHVSWVTGWSCRWCAAVYAVRQMEHDVARLLAEAERITRDAA